jgi:hypothetical protein
METFYSDKKNIFKCKIQVEGASIKNTKGRLILNVDEKNLLFHGKLNENGEFSCEIPALKEFEEPIDGNVILEVISEDTFCEAWKDKLHIKKSKKIKVEKFETIDSNLLNENKVEETKPKVSIIKEEKVLPFNKNILNESISEHDKSDLFEFNEYLNNLDNKTKNYYLENAKKLNESNLLDIKNIFKDNLSENNLLFSFYKQYIV